MHHQWVNKGVSFRSLYDPYGSTKRKLHPINRFNLQQNQLFCWERNGTPATGRKSSPYRIHYVRGLDTVASVPSVVGWFNKIQLYEHVWRRKYTYQSQFPAIKVLETQSLHNLIHKCKVCCCGKIGNWPEYWHSSLWPVMLAKALRYAINYHK